MPAATTHIEAAREVYRRLDPELMAQITNLPMFFLGAQGPDLFFFSQGGILPGTLRELGNLLHENRIYGVIHYFLDHTHNDKDLRSYVYGYICHYALDSVCHPLVNYDALNYPHGDDPVIVNHFRIESFIDTTILKQNGKTIRDFDADRCVKVTKQDGEKLAKLYHGLFRSLFKKDIPTKQLETNIHQVSTFLHVLKPTSKAKFHRFEAIEKVVKQGHFITALMLYNESLPDGEALLNHDHHTTFNPSYPSLTNTHSFEELYEQGIEKTLRLYQDLRNPSNYDLDFEGNPTSEEDFLITIEK